MQTTDWIRTTLWDYNYWATYRLLDALETISDNDFTRPNAYSVGSIHTQLVHIMWAEAVWYTRLHEQPRPLFTADDYPTLASIRVKWSDIKAQWMQYLSDLTDDQLDTDIQVIRGNGDPYTMTIRSILHHVPNHGTNHRAQILSLVHQYGGETFEQDMTAYIRYQQEKDA